MCNKNVLRKYALTLKRFGKKHGIDVDGIDKAVLVGAFYHPHLGIVEYVMHELAHILTLNKCLDYIPKDIPEYIEDEIGGLHDKVREDSLERDTAVVTYFSGLQLGLWTSGDIYIGNETAEDRIRKSCWKNHSKLYITKEFKPLWQEAMEKNSNKDLSSKLTKFIQDIAS